MAASYIPHRDAEFTNWAGQYVTFVSTDGPALGITAEQISTLQGLLGSWNAGYGEHLTASNESRAATQNKNTRRENFEALARPIAMLLQNNPAMTDAQRAEAGLTVRGQTPPMPEDLVHETDPPLIVLDFSKRRQMTIHWGPNPENGRNNALPEGTRGAKLFCHIGGIPADENDWVWLADDTRSPYIHLLNNSAPITIAYRAQYFDRRMNTGPFGDPVVATISA